MNMEILNRRFEFTKYRKLPVSTTKPKLWRGDLPMRQNQTMAELICQHRSFPVQVGSPLGEPENG
jgi:hypothetical protein